MDSIYYKFLVEENFAKIKEHVRTQQIADGLFELKLIDEKEFEHFEKLTNDESLEIVFKKLSQYDNSGSGYKLFIEDVIQSKYGWLYKDIQVKLTDNSWIQDKYKNRLNYGDFPRKPAHYVERSDKIKQVQDVLKRLSSIGKVILCGMTGSGKTSLVMGIMTKEIVLDVCAGNVFWITVGDVDEEQLLMLLSRFYLKLSDENAQENNLFSSKDVLKDKLKKKIRDTAISSQMLLVLDNVCNRNVIEAFDIGCKVLITTQNRDIWRQDLDTEFIEVDGSFKFDETCHLFAKCLDKPVKYVQNIPEVHRIHELCQGHPFSIALFGSQIATYKDKLLDRHSRMWKTLSEVLQKNANQQNTVISSCIEILDEEIRNKFSDFAIFPNDVNISSKVLQIFWGLEEVQVIEIMRKLENKSLIVSYYSNDQHNYIFGIHIVLLSFLKTRYRNELREKHRKLISAYKKSCDEDFSRLINDNYIFQYIGYHLKQAECLQDFNIYFDLKFIGAKIKAVGIGDVLKDFNLYRKEIQGHTYPNNTGIINEIETFIKKFGDDMHKYEDISIIQCALKYAKDSFIYRTAMDIAIKSPSSLYFKIKVPQKNCDNHISEFTLPENCTFVCFGREEHQLLIGTKEGVIELWDRTYRKVTCKFIGHTQNIRYIELDPERNSFLSVSDDGLVHLWKFRLHKQDSIPSLVQSNHRTFFGEENNVSPSYTFKPEENDHFVTASFCNDYPKDLTIIIGSQKGDIQIYKGDEKKCLHLPTNPIENLKFSDDDTLILGNSSNKLFVWTSDLIGSISEVMETPIISILVCDDDSFVTLHETSVFLWRFKSKRMPGDQLPNIKRTCLCTSVGTQKFMCCLIDENCLYVVTNDYKVVIFDINVKLKKPKLKTISTYDNEINDYVTAADFYYAQESSLLLKHKNNILKFYTPKTLVDHNHKHKPIFDSFWTEKQVRLVTVDSNNSVQISNNFNALSELESFDRAVTTVLFSPSGDSIVIGLESGEVFEYEIKTNHRKSIMRLPFAISHLKYFDDGRIIAVASKKGDLMVRSGDRNVCLVADSDVSTFQPEPIVQMFYFGECDALLTISVDRGIKVWYLSKNKMQVLRGRKQSHVTHLVQMSVMSKDGRLLALTMSNMFDLFLIDRSNDAVNLIDFGGLEVKHELYSCCFSHDSRYLAVGSADGVIIVYSIDLDGNSFYEHTKLHSHVSKVRCLQFAPHYSHLLVSVGEQVIWWNLKRVPDSSITRNRRSRRSRPPINDLIRMTDDLVVSHQMCNKFGSETKPHLLRAIKLKGSYANSISASPNFKSFVTKDNEGVSYIMEMIE